jgi:hypothetical protein
MELPARSPLQKLFGFPGRRGWNAVLRSTTVFGKGVWGKNLFFRKVFPQVNLINQNHISLSHPGQCPVCPPAIACCRRPLCCAVAARRAGLSLTPCCSEWGLGTSGSPVPNISLSLPNCRSAVRPRYREWGRRFVKKAGPSPQISPHDNDRVAELAEISIPPGNAERDDVLPGCLILGSRYP